MSCPKFSLLSSSESPKKSKKKFTVNEDALLIKYVSLFGDNNWKLISKYFKNRNTRQLRERYTLYLKPGIVDTPWTHEEDLLLSQKIKEIGKHWSLIAKYFKGRNQNNIKNRWNFHLKCGANLHIENDTNGRNHKNSNVINNNMNNNNNHGMKYYFSPNFSNSNGKNNLNHSQNSDIIIKRHFYVLPIIKKESSTIGNGTKKIECNSSNKKINDFRDDEEFKLFYENSFSDFFESIDDENFI